MKARTCSRCGERGPTALAGKDGLPVCQKCLFEEELAAKKETAS